MRLTIIRHGESEGNAQKRHGGHHDFSLTEKGREQATAIAKRLENERFDHIYVSDLTRTRQTAEPIIALHPRTPVTYDERIREKHLGIYEGALQNVSFDKWGDPEGGETQRELEERIERFLDHLFEHHQTEHVLLVTHGGYITTMLMRLAGSNDIAAYHPKNAGVSIVEFDIERNHVIHLIGDDSHLHD